MKALVYQGPGTKAWKDVPDPTLQADTDVIVRVGVTTICGTDLHILKGDTPEVTAGRILGHEAVGTVEQVGSGVKTLSVGDRVLVSCITACGSCRFCREGRYGQCLGGGGWILGHLIDGTQAELVRVPFADTSTYPVPKGVKDEEILMLADILPTAYEVGVLNGHVQPGDTVAIVGAGPIGLSAITGAKLFSPSSIICSSRRRGTCLARTAMIIMGKSPTSISGVPSFASVDATANVLAATSPSPPPMACPFTFATTGLSQFVSARRRSA